MSASQQQQQQELILPSGIFNTNKTDYSKPQLFFGEPNGLLDSIHKPYTKLWSLYETLKASDWKPNDFNYSSCIHQFKTCPEATYKRMIRTLSWQWSGDSIAASSIVEIMSCVTSATELRVGYVEIAKNENIHALTYSEIARGSFENPEAVLAEVLAVRESFMRLSALGGWMEEARVAAHRYAAGDLPYSQELYEKILMFVICVYCLERISFMASFAVTAGVCGTNMFQPINKAVQMIARDEYSVHVPFGEEVIRIELATARGQLAFKNLRSKILKTINACVANEYDWTEYLYHDIGDDERTPKAQLNKWVMNCAAPVYSLFGMLAECPYPVPTEIALPYMMPWLDVSENQDSPQEEDGNAYLSNVISANNISDKKFSFSRKRA